MESKRIGLALSGGGHRATAWGLGSLLAITDMGLNGQVVSISSVSGGSIANGVAAHQGAYGSTSSADFEKAIGPALRHISSEGLFFFGPATDGWLLRFFVAVGLFIDLAVALLAATLAAGRHWAPAWWLVTGVILAAAGWWVARKLPTKVRVTLAAVLALSGPLAAVAVAITTDADSRGSVVVSVAGLLVLTGVSLLLAFRMFRGRSKVVDRAMARLHFSSDGRSTRLADVDGTVHHVFCATELHAGDHAYLTPRVVYGYRFGKGTPGDLTLATAVQCSACLPGAFSPRRLPTRGFGLSRPWEVEGNNPPEIPDEIVVNDGGVYDNMADQWEQGMDGRDDRVAPSVQAPAEELVVVNAGKAMGWSPFPTSSLKHEFSGLTRTIDILYDVSTSHRRQAMIARFRAAAELGEGLTGALVHVAQSPFRVPTRYQMRSDEAGERARTALAALATLGRDAAGWDALTRSNPGVPTTLGALGASVTADLLEHAWVLTVVNVYVTLGYGEDLIRNLAAGADRARFEALCG